MRQSKTIPTDLSPKDDYQEVLTEAAARACNYLRTIRDRDVGVSQEALDKLPLLGGPMPRSGENPQWILRLLDEIGSPATMATMGGRFFGGVIGGALPATVAAHWMADAWDQNASLFDFSPVSAYLEDVVLGWLLNLFGLPPTRPPSPKPDPLNIAVGRSNGEKRKSRVNQW